MIKFLDIKRQYHSIQEEVDAAIREVISETAFIGGENVRHFEENFAAYQEAAFCVGVGNGTDALEIAIEALGFEPCSEILVPANSFIASSEAVTRAGHQVVFCDCDEANYTISSASIRANITERTVAIIAVHLYGHPCDMDELQEIADEYGLKIIEDCAQAHGARYKGRRIGAIGDVGAFSFYPGKNLGAFGDGGAIISNDEALASKCRMIANHGRIKKYDHEFEGRNSRLDGLQAAILSVKLRHLDGWLEKRRSVAEMYGEKLKGVEGVILPGRETWAEHSYHLFVIRVENRDALKAHLTENGVQSGIHYPVSLPELGAYSYLQQDCSEMFAWGLGEKLLSLPMGDHLGEDEVEVVADSIRYFLAAEG